VRSDLERRRALLTAALGFALVDTKATGAEGGPARAGVAGWIPGRASATSWPAWPARTTTSSSRDTTAAAGARRS